MPNSFAKIFFPWMCFSSAISARVAARSDACSTDWPAETAVNTPSRSSLRHGSAGCPPRPLDAPPATSIRLAHGASYQHGLLLGEHGLQR
jgi:hypothetical protein